MCNLNAKTYGQFFLVVKLVKYWLWTWMGDRLGLLLLSVLDIS